MTKPQLRCWLAKRDGWKCRYCSVHLNHGTATIDHILPRAHGGTWNIHNLALSCRTCNMQKGAKLPHAFHNECCCGLGAAA